MIMDAKKANTYLACLFFLFSLNIFAGSSNVPPGFASCGTPDFETEGKIESALKGLYVTIDDSSNCGGDGASGSFISQAVMPDFCGEYEVRVTVEGRVETMHYGYDEVSLNGDILFGSEGLGVECGMKNAVGSAILSIRGGDAITLGYTTNDPHYHVGAYARVTDVRIVGRPSCSDGGSPGVGGVGIGCAWFSASLGRTASGRHAGMFSFEYDTPTSVMFTRGGLSLFWAESDPSLSVLADVGGIPVVWSHSSLGWCLASDGSEYAGAGVPVIRRVSTPECVVDLADIVGGYEIRYYLPSQFQGEQPTGEPYLVWRIRAATETPGVADRMEVTEIRGESVVSVSVLEYDSSTGDWSRVSGSGEDTIRETVGERDVAGGVLRFRMVQDASGSTVSYKANLCREFPWGEEVIEERNGLVSPRVTVHTFYDDATNDGNCYGLLKQTVSHDGSWTRYSYDAEGRVVREVSPWVDTLPESADSLCKVVEYTYSDSFPQTTVVTRIAGEEVSRVYSGKSWGYGYSDSHFVQAASSGAAWHAPGNMRNFTRRINDRLSPFNGTVLAEVNANGTGILRRIEPGTDGTYAVTVEEGRIASPWSDTRRVVSGTRSVNTCGSDGRVLSSEVYDIESGIQLWTGSYSYDNFGRRTGVEYSDGTSEAAEYGCCGPVRTVSRDGSETLMGYNADGRLSFCTVGDITTFFTYDADGRKVAETVLGADGRTLTARSEYDEYGDLVAAVTPAGRRTEYSRGIVDGHWTETTVNPGGGTEVTSYNLDGSVNSVSGTGTATVEYVYSVDDSRRVVRTVWPDMRGGKDEWSETTRDFLGRVAVVSYPDGTHSTTSYDDFGRVVRETSPAGRVTLHAYSHPVYGDITAVDMDGDGRIGFNGPDTVNASRAFCAQVEGRPVRRVEVWRFEDTTGTPRLVSRTDTAIDGRFIVETSDGVVTRDEVLFKGVSRVLRKVTSRDGAVAEQEWISGRLRRASSELGGVSEFFYDGFSRLYRTVTQQNGVRRSTLTEYDADGNAVAETVSSGGEGRTLRRTLDADGNVVREEGADGIVLRFEYDLRGNLVLEHGDTYRVAYAYDHRGRRISMTTWRNAGEEGDTTQWNYDSRGRMVRKTYADGTHIDYAYDADGNVTSRTSARGVVRIYAYDMGGRPVSVSYTDGTPSTACIYDRAGRMVSVTDAAGTRTLGYDTNGNCVSESVPQVPGCSLSRTFDTLNRRTGICLGNGINADVEATFAYDELGRVASVTCGESEVVIEYRTHGNDIAGKRWQKGGGDVASVAAAYDAWSDITEISFSTAGDVHRMGYRYDSVGRRTRTELADGTSWLYGYDRLSQVISGERVDAQGAAVDGGSFRYAYDGIGNRASSQDGSVAETRHYVANSLNQYVSVFTPGHIPVSGRADADAEVTITAMFGGQTTVYRPARDGQMFHVDIPVNNPGEDVIAHITVDAVRRDGTLDIDLRRRLSGDYSVPRPELETLSYDADGNLLSRDGWAYTWNGENCLASAEKDGVRLEFQYDYMGRRFEKRVYEGNVLVKHQKFVYNDFKLIAEYNVLSSNALTNTYVWQPTGLDVPLLRNGGEFYVTDTNKNVVALIDSNGNIVDTYVYSPFGRCEYSGGSTNPFRFSSEYQDDETGLVYFNYRYYSPEDGRWISRDPIEEIGSYNLFLYCNNNSIGQIDYLGMISIVSPPAAILRCATIHLTHSSVISFIEQSISKAEITNFIRGVCIDKLSLPSTEDFSSYISKIYASSFIVKAINATKNCISNIPLISGVFDIELKVEKVSKAVFRCDDCIVKYMFSFQTALYLTTPFKNEPYIFNEKDYARENRADAAFQVCCH